MTFQIDSILDPIVCQRLFVCLVHFLWQACAIGLMAFFVSKLLRGHSSHLRYRVYLVLLMLIVLCMPITYLNLPLRSDESAASWPDIRAVTQIPNHREVLGEVAKIASTVGRPNHVQSRPGPVFQVDRRDPAEFLEQDEVIRNPHRPIRHATTFVFLWGVGVVIMLLRLMVATWSANILVRSSNPFSNVEWRRVCQREAVRLGLKFTPKVSMCYRVSAPVVSGCFKPIVLLPPALASGLSMKELELVLSHEFAHIRRLDPVVNMMQRTVESLFFFHPVVWYLSRLTSIERENCCDDLVVATGVKQLELADVLLRAAEVCFKSRPQAVGLSLLGRHQSALKGRVMRLVRPTQPVRFGGASLVMILVLLVGMLFLFQLQTSNAMNLQSNTEQATGLFGRKAAYADDLVAVLGGGRGRVWGLPQHIEEAQGRIWITESNGAVSAFDAKTLERLGSFHAHPKRCLDLSLFREGRQIVTISVDGSVRLWDISTNRPKRVDSYQVEEENESSWLKMSASKSQQLVAVRGTKRLVLLDVRLGKLVERDDFPVHLDSFALSPNGQWLVGCQSSTAPTELQVWDVSNWKPRLVCKTEHTASVQDFTFLQPALDGPHADADYELISRAYQHIDPQPATSMWKLQAGELAPLKPLPVKSNSWTSPAASEDGQSVAMVKAGKLIVLRRKQDTWKREANLDVGRVFSTKVLDDGSIVAASQTQLQRWEPSDDGFGSTQDAILGHRDHVSGLLFDLRNGSLLTSSDDSLREWKVADPLAAHQLSMLPYRGVHKLVPMPNRAGFLILGNDGEDKLVKAVRRNRAGKTVTQFNINFGNDYRKNAWSVALHPTKDILVTGHWDHHIRVWDVSDTPLEIGSWKAVRGHVCDVEFSPDGTKIAVAGWDKTTQLWDFDEDSIRRGKKPTGIKIGQHEDIVREVAFSRDGRFVASGGEDGQILLWDQMFPAADPKSLMHPGTIPTSNSLDSKKVGSLQFSKDGSELLSADGKGRVTIWSLDSLEIKKKWELPGWVWRAAFAPDEKIVATANGDGSIYLLKR